MKRLLVTFSTLTVLSASAHALTTQESPAITPFVLAPATQEAAAARTPVSIPKAQEAELRQRMQGFLAHQQKVIYLLGKREYRAAGIMADLGHGHAEVGKYGPIGAQKYWPDAMKKVSKEMREATKAFVDLTETSQDGQAIVAAYNKAIGACNTCHTTFKAEYTGG